MKLEKKISVEQLKSYLYIRSARLGSFYAGMRNAYALRACLLFLSCSWILPSFGYKKKRYLLASSHHLNLIETNKRSQVVILGGIAEFILALKFGCGFINTSALYISITLNCFTFFRYDFFRNYCGERFCKKILEIHNFEFLLIDSDGLPYKRVLCLLSQAVCKKVVCLQHGIFPDPMPEIDGSLSNLNLVIDPNQIPVFLKSGVSKETLVLLDSVSSERRMRINFGRVKPQVILVGEGWVSHDLLRHKKYISTLKNLRSQISKLNIDVIYRPHPSERYAFWRHYDLLPVEFSKRSKNIFPWNVYIGTMSSLLVEAKKIGATAIQITDIFPLQQNYEEYGVIQSTVANIRAKLEGLKIPESIHEAVLHQRLKFLNLDKISYAITSSRQ